MCQSCEFTKKNAISYLYILSWYFFILFYFFSFIHQENFVFIILISFFDKTSNFQKQIINQSETSIGDKKLSVELYVT